MKWQWRSNRPTIKTATRCCCARAGAPRERAYELGIDYYKRTPSIHFDAAALLAKKMDEMGSGLFMTDCGLVNPP